MARAASLLVLALLGGGCLSPSGEASDAGPLPDDAGPDEEHDGDGGPPPDGGPEEPADAGPLWEGIVRRERSLAWTDAALLDDPHTIGLGRVLAPAAERLGTSPGAVLNAWLRRFATTAHSERAAPARLAEELALTLGADVEAWDVDRAPFRVTGVHNRTDLMQAGAAPHCGELRVSLASTAPLIRPFHALFLFRQPAGDGDRAPPGSDAPGALTCAATALRWAALSDVDDDAFRAGARALLEEALTAPRFLMIETVELTVSPWEWRQWAPDGDGPGAALENPPLFQQIDTEAVNAPGTLREAFLAFVEQNAAALDARALLIPERFRPRSRRVTQGVPAVPLDLSGVSPATLAAFPELRRHIEIVGCTACHTADAEFVQTREDRTFSPFYTKELTARGALLAEILRHGRPAIPFGPLQADPVLPP
jgi:hypothetical protein